MPHRPPSDTIAPLVERLNHLEVLIVSNLLGFLLTATTTAIAAIYEMRSGSKAAIITPEEVLIGASALYFFLGGYYYFMLAQFYACIIALIPHAKAVDIDVDVLWGTLRYPTLGLLSKRNANIAMLLSAPALPLAFSIGSLLFFRLLIEGNGTRGIGMLPTIVCLLLQVLICGLTITAPFRDFIKAAVK